MLQRFERERAKPNDASMLNGAPCANDARQMHPRSGRTRVQQISLMNEVANQKRIFKHAELHKLRCRLHMRALVVRVGSQLRDVAVCMGH